jgi:hypothetical protein
MEEDLRTKQLIPILNFSVAFPWENDNCFWYLKDVMQQRRE